MISVAFSPDGKLILSGSSDKSVKLWDETSGNLLQSLDGQNDIVTCRNFSPAGKLILSGILDKSIKLGTKHRKIFLKALWDIIVL